MVENLKKLLYIFCNIPSFFYLHVGYKNCLFLWRWSQKKNGLSITCKTLTTTFVRKVLVVQEIQE